MKTVTSGFGNDDPPAAAPPPWRECEVFCSRGHAGLADEAPCGWRGREAAAPLCPRLLTRRCPRCGHAALLPVPRPSAGG